MIWEESLGSYLGLISLEHNWDNWHIPSGNESWLAGKSTVNGSFNGKSTYKSGNFIAMFDYQSIII